MHKHNYIFVDVVVLGKIKFRVFKCNRCGRTKLRKFSKGK